MNYNFDPEHTFFTSDTHFNHANIIRLCDRPFKNMEQMNETMIANWNQVIGPDDTIFHLGDFCLGGSAEWTKVLDRLNGKIYFILGNHDLKNLRQGFINRFEHVAMQMHIEIGKQRIYLSHFPFLCFEREERYNYQPNMEIKANDTFWQRRKLRGMQPIHQDGWQLFDEYGDKIDPDKFWDEYVTCMEDGWTGETYDRWEREQGYYYHSAASYEHVTSAGLRFARDTDFC